MGLGIGRIGGAAAPGRRTRALAFARRATGALALAGAAALAFPSAHATLPAIAAGADRACAIDSAGALDCWGDDSSGALGAGSRIAESSPKSVLNLAPGTRALASGPGAYHTCAIDANGGAFCWGLGTYGQLGSGTNDYSAVPGPVRGLDTGVAQVVGGYLHTCALRTAGDVYCWGSNSSGQLGVGEFSLGSDLPVAVGNLPSATALSAGLYHTCALTAAGAVYCWGYNNGGQLGIGTTASSASPVVVSGLESGVVAISSGYYHSCALKSGGAMMCWGFNADGQLGIGSTQQSLVPVPVAGLSSGVQSIATGGFHTCAVSADATRCWGYNVDGELGLGTTVQGTTPAIVAGLPGVPSRLVAGEYHTCALLSGGDVWCWGYGGYGQLGNAQQLATNATPVRASALAVPATQIVAGALHTCALTAGGQALCWGENSFFQLGDGRALGITTPSRVGQLPAVTGVSAGDHHTCAVDRDGALWCWGEDANGQLGTGDILGSTSRARKTLLTSGVASVSAGGSHTCALTTAGAVLCWGENAVGDVGDGTTVDRATPASVTGLDSGIVAVGAGHAHTCALDARGAVSCWGYNAYGQLGAGSTVNYSTTPVAATGLPPIANIAVSGWHTCALSTQGAVYCWGDNADGQVGDGTFANRSTPVPVSGLGSGIKAIAAGDEHSCALTAAGGVLCWGYNYYGQLGDGTQAHRATPVPVAGLSSGVAAIAAGSNHTCALKVEGDVLCWGYNSSGGLGDGTFSSHPTLVVVAREGGAGSIATNDWFLDLRPDVPKAISSDRIPPYLVDTFGNAATAIVDVKSDIQFRAQDVGHPIFVFAYVPAGLLKRGTAAAKKDVPTGCVLAQIGANGQPIDVSASGVQNAVGNVQSTARQQVSILSNVPASNLSGSTVCVGTGASGTEAVTSANSRCVATVPPGDATSPLCVPPEAAANTGGALSGLWYNASESGWGLSLTQRRNILFAAWYTYDDAGAPKWYVAPNCPLPSAAATGSCNSALYEVSGPRFFGVPFDPAARNVSQAGTLELTFAGTSSATMTYSVGSHARTVAISREVFRTGSAAPAIDYTDLWYDPDEPGWGLSVTHQYDMMFLAWYVYDGAGKPVWYVAPACGTTATGCSGSLFRTTGPPLGATFDPTRVTPFAAGDVSVNFSDGNNGTVSYTVDGVSASKPITRQLF